MFVDSSLDFTEFTGKIGVGDLLDIKPGMMLIVPVDPVLVLDADNDKGIYEIMYTHSNYVISCGRMDIKAIANKAR